MIRIRVSGYAASQIYSASRSSVEWSIYGMLLTSLVLTVEFLQYMKSVSHICGHVIVRNALILNGNTFGEQGARVQAATPKLLMK
ncbi:hypothetical protein Y032_0041g344 [Ancylostoma ceylanicum]|uniref:Uncharacterized protein n=1 Tax=Ancylostoma ceylanicum TaxID=53326 RepID=A0A016UG34_9BILA|nr:hypothetical protein Y032_0041g344 [Ancylostoma ceylanicum]